MIPAHYRRVALLARDVAREHKIPTAVAASLGTVMIIGASPPLARALARGMIAIVGAVAQGIAVGTGAALSEAWNSVKPALAGSPGWDPVWGLSDDALRALVDVSRDANAYIRGGR